MSILLIQLLAILGAVGVISLFNNVLNYHPFVQRLIDSWQSLTVPVWENSIGLIAPFFGVNLFLPIFASDYLALIGILLIAGPVTGEFKAFFASLVAYTALIAVVSYILMFANI